MKFSKLVLDAQTMHVCSPCVMSILMHGLQQSFLLPQASLEDSLNTPLFSSIKPLRVCSLSFSLFHPLILPLVSHQPA